MTEREALRGEMLIQLQDEIERQRAELKRVEKERDEAVANAKRYWDLLGLPSPDAIERARELAEKGPRTIAAYPDSDLTNTPYATLAEIARLLSGDEKERPNPAHPDWFPPDGTGKAK